MGTSPFFNTPPQVEVGNLAILHLKRDNMLAINLKATADEGYVEGAVTNTRFGSFPHSTLIGLEWGSQVRASKVDTGTRGRKSKKMPAKKTKLQCAEESSEGRKGNYSASTPVEAGSGFIHILQPTPETWTASLDHRTQVVYPSDYSYILQRLRVKPGSTIIEAGAGSGSFTHAAARAVFSGHTTYTLSESQPNPEMRPGKVYSFEFHAPRVETLQQEVVQHGLDKVVHLTHRDVCADGFLLQDSSSPKAQAIFLDLPAPWIALQHLTRRQASTPLDAMSSVHLCSFSPCIEQVMATVSQLRKSGWTEIEMVEVNNHRIDVRREQVGYRNEGLRGANASAATVEECVARLKEVEQKLGAAIKKLQGKQERLEKLRKQAAERKLYKEGNLVHRTEPEVKTHTSYLVFAVLPRDWSEADEERTAGRWHANNNICGEKDEQ
ncbi:hypothetical protein M433DRAFT_57149 [Acidomyces richmondensis BFW]|nr:MAG: hypothetical protein FE78DRAFT_135910 [Acidomyces sp. 'richmondensis']KYG50443.1 hypothetical protein M433DRAFT_57149 [Acidomyces richmondensis BFW]